MRRMRGRIDKPCWEWPGYVNKAGYGVASTNGKCVLAHRKVFESMVGPIPEGLTLDHLCRNRLCVNPAHLEPVTHAENMRRCEAAQKPTCVNGHPFDETNTYIRHGDGKRDCRQCTNARARAYRKRQAA